MEDFLLALIFGAVGGMIVILLKARRKKLSVGGREMLRKLREADLSTEAKATADVAYTFRAGSTEWRARYSELPPDEETIVSTGTTAIKIMRDKLAEVRVNPDTKLPPNEEAIASSGRKQLDVDAILDKIAEVRANPDKYKRMMVFDWVKAREILEERKPEIAYWGLDGDWHYNSAIIWQDGKMVEEGMVCDASLWAIPSLKIGDELIPCFYWEEEAEEGEA